MVKEGGVNLISKRKARLIEFLPEKIVIKIARRTIDGYLNKYAKITNLGIKIIKHISIKPNTADKEAIIEMINILKGGENLLLFPEGTRSRTGRLIEGKKGAILVARMSKANIIPISLTGTEKLLPINGEGNMSQEKWNDAIVNVNIGEPILMPKKNKKESKHEYDERCLNHLMQAIAQGLPEEYKGVYK